MNRSLLNHCVATASIVAFVVIVGLTMAALPAKATVYTDALGDNYGGPEVDISNVVITNDATNIYFQINLNNTANIGPTANRYANYEVGIQVGGGAGGQTLINGNYTAGDPTAGNPYGNSVGISTGENYFIGSYLDGTSFSGGAQLSSYSSVTGWSAYTTAPITEVYTGTPSTAFSYPLAALGLSPGSSFKFDVWTSFGSPQSAYDALGYATLPPGAAPYSGGSTDSATVLSTYTVAVPEPGSVVLAAMGGISLLSSCFRGRRLKG